MFRREGFGRDARLNTLIAGALATIAGFVNSAGFVLLGVFTSHVTGNVGRIGSEVADAHWTAALFSLTLVLAFFVGSFAASLIIEGGAQRIQEAYGWALLAQGLLLVGFLSAGGAWRAEILCTAMGMQNSLVTRLSGAVVRTTHLTGITTDLGIEAARWYRWHRERVGPRPLLRGRARPTRPHARQFRLLLTIMLTYVFGALLGATLTAYAQRWSMLLPALSTLALSAYAFSQPNPDDHE